MRKIPTQVGGILVFIGALLILVGTTMVKTYVIIFWIVGLILMIIAVWILFSNRDNHLP